MQYFLVMTQRNVGIIKNALGTSRMTSKITYGTKKKTVRWEGILSDFNSLNG